MESRLATKMIEFTINEFLGAIQKNTNMFNMNFFTHLCILVCSDKKYEVATGANIFRNLTLKPQKLVIR